MRTTVDFPDILMREVSLLAASQDRSLKSVLTEALQLGLHRKAATVPRWTSDAYSLGGTRADYTKAWALVDGLEADAVAEKLDRLK